MTNRAGRRDDEIPLFIHDCPACQFLGWWKERDLYFCSNAGVPMVVQRFGNAHEDFQQGLGTKLDEALAVAQAVALQRGMVSAAEVAGADTTQETLDEVWSQALNHYGTLEGRLKFIRLPLRQQKVWELLRNNERLHHLCAKREDLTEAQILFLAQESPYETLFLLSQRAGLPRSAAQLLASGGSEELLSSLSVHAGLPIEIRGLAGEFPYLPSWNDALVDEVTEWPWDGPDQHGNVQRTISRYARPPVVPGDFLLWKEMNGEKWNLIFHSEKGGKAITGKVVLPRAIDGWVALGQFGDQVGVFGAVLPSDDGERYWFSPLIHEQISIGWLGRISASADGVGSSDPESVPEGARSLGMAMMGSGKERGLMVCWGTDNGRFFWSREQTATGIPQINLRVEGATTEGAPPLERGLPRLWDGRVSRLGQWIRTIAGIGLGL